MAFTRAFHRHFIRPISIPYVTVVNYFAKRNKMTFTITSELVAGLRHVTKKLSTVVGQLK
jgi:hypothetical protein